MTSPPCNAGSNADNLCASVSFGSPIAFTKKFESWADTSTARSMTSALTIPLFADCANVSNQRTDLLAVPTCVPLPQISGVDILLRLAALCRSAGYGFGMEAGGASALLTNDSELIEAIGHL